MIRMVKTKTPSQATDLLRRTLKGPSGQVRKSIAIKWPWFKILKKNKKFLTFF